MTYVERRFLRPRRRSRDLRVRRWQLNSWSPKLGAKPRRRDVWWRDELQTATRFARQFGEPAKRVIGRERPRIDGRRRQPESQTENSRPKKPPRSSHRLKQSLRELEHKWKSSGRSIRPPTPPLG
jgi:hypothetical protein